MSDETEFREGLAASLARIEEKLKSFPCAAHSERMDRIDARLEFLTRTLLLTSLSAVVGAVAYLGKVVVGMVY
ncbi:MAG: hypothetical protein ABSA41_12545 [Terriglobia bacterium]|jgi:hypothetical protein